jgi:hypothetical protein
VEASEAEDKEWLLANLAHEQNMLTHSSEVNTVTASGEQAEAVSGLLHVDVCIESVMVLDTGTQSTLSHGILYMLSIDTCDDEVESCPSWSFQLLTCMGRMVCKEGKNWW